MLFTFPSRYWFTIGHSGVFSLARWCWRIQTEFHRLRPTQDTNLPALGSRTGLSPCAVRLSNRLPFPIADGLRRSYNPARAVTPAVWATPRSLAATWGIPIGLFSSRYLDVSVPGVRPPCGVPAVAGGLPHSDTPGSSAVCAYPGIFAAYHVLRRL